MINLFKKPEPHKAIKECLRSIDTNLDKLIELCLVQDGCMEEAGLEKAEMVQEEAKT